MKREALRKMRGWAQEHRERGCPLTGKVILPI